MRNFTIGLALGLLIASGAALATDHNTGVYGEGYNDYWRNKNRQQSEEQWRKDFTERNSTKQPC